MAAPGQWGAASALPDPNRSGLARPWRHAIPVAADLPLVAFLSSVLAPAVVTLSLIACTLAFGEAFTGHYLLLAVLAFFISSQVIDDIDLVTPWRGYQLTHVGRNVLVGWSMVCGIVLFLGYATKLTNEFSQQVILTWFALAPLALLAALKLTRVLVRKAVRSAGLVRSVIVVGANDLGLRLAQKIRDDLSLSFELKGLFDDRAAERLGSAPGPVLGRLGDVAAFVREHGVNQVYVSLPMVAQPRIVRLIEELRDTTASVYFVPDIFVFDLVQARFDEVDGIPVLAICETPLYGINSVLKRASDLVIASLILLVVWPVLLATALGVKFSSPGAAIFRQRRYGLDGEEIVVYKFRTMTVCEDANRIQQATRSDRRVTRFGAFLRRTSLDELPQLFNVLGGTMSMVGPRPHAVAHNEMYRKLISGYMLRHKVKPGITGWAQINGLRGETETVEKMRRRVEFDIDYLRNWSLSLDLWIILRTLPAVFAAKNAY